MQKRNKIIALMLCSLYAVSCSSGQSAPNTGTTPEPPVTQPDQNPDVLPVMNQGIWIPESDGSGAHLQSDIFDVSEPKPGELHVLNGSPEGVITYATCSRNCDSEGNWRSVQLESGGLFEDVPLQLEVGADGRVHVAIGNSNGLYYWTCAQNCTTKSNWQQIMLEEETELVNQFGTGGDWLTLTPQGQPRLILHDSLGQIVGGAYFIYGCDTNCTDVNNWNRTRIAEAAGTDGVFDLQWTANHGVHFLVGDYILEDDNGGNYLTHFSCLKNCEDEANWKHVRIYNWGGDSVGEARTLTVMPNGDVMAAYVQQNSGQAHIQRCSGNCENPNSWQKQAVVDLSGFGNKWQAIGGDVDSTYTGGQYVLGTLGQFNQGDHVTEALQISCTNCDLNAQWKVKTALSTDKDAWPDMDALFKYMYTALDWNVKVTSTGRMGLVVLPHWLSDPSQLGDDTLADVKWLNMLTLTKDPV